MREIDLGGFTVVENAGFAVEEMCQDMKDDSIVVR